MAFGIAGSGYMVWVMDGMMMAPGRFGGGDDERKFLPVLQRYGGQGGEGGGVGRGLGLCVVIGGEGFKKLGNFLGGARRKLLPLLFLRRRSGFEDRRGANGKCDFSFWLGRRTSAI